MQLASRISPCERAPQFPRARARAGLVRAPILVWVVALLTACQPAGSGDDGSDVADDDDDDDQTASDYEGPEPNTYEPVVLESARVGVRYSPPRLDRALGLWPGYKGRRPPGVEFDETEGSFHGVPTEAGIFEFSIVVEREDDQVVELGVQLAVYAADDSGIDHATSPENPGPYPPASLTVTVPSITTTHGMFDDVDVLVTYPASSDDDATLADGRFPLIVFHHAAHRPPDIFASYTALHEHWASWGYLVASVDSTMNLTPPGTNWIGQSWDNLSDMSTFQRAALDRVLDLDEEPTSSLFGHVERTRLFVSGHSRGGGASLISMTDDPRLMGAILFEPVSPIQTPEQDFGDAARHFDRDLPAKPLLFFVASNDLDEPWPFVEASFEQRTGHATVVTLHGANHEWTYDEGTPGDTTSESSITFAQRHDLDQWYSTAFLERFARADPSFDSALFGPRSLSSDLSPEGVTTAFDRNMSTREIVDDFGSADDDVNLQGGSNTGVGLTTNTNATPYTEGFEARDIDDERLVRIDRRSRARELRGQAGSELQLRFDGLDATDLRYAVLRASRYCGPPPQDCPSGSIDIDVAVVDGHGDEFVWSSDIGVAGELGVRARHWTNVVLPLAAADAAIDRGDLTAIHVRLVDGGHVWIDDVRFE